MSRRVMNEPAPAADERIAYGDRPNQFIDFRYPPGTDSTETVKKPGTDTYFAMQPSDYARALPRNGLSVPGFFTDPTETGALAIYIHGGFWRARIDLTHSGHPCAAIAAAGHVSASIEYRRAGEDGGGWPGTLDDVRAAIRFARDRHPGLRTIVLGHSAGGHLALCMASEMSDLHRVVALGAVADPRRAWELNLGDGAAAGFFGGTPEQFPGRYTLQAPLCPVVLIHGTADEIVPIELARSYRHGRLIEIQGGDHFDPIDPQTSAFAEVLRALA